MPNSIFISYRRHSESTGYAGRLADRLRRAFGEEEYFRDVDDIKPGTDFVEAIAQHMASCRVLLVIIGTDWLTVTDAAGRPRLSDPRDWVRLEVATGLRHKAVVLPVLVGGATMPGEEDLPDEVKILARRQAIDLSDSRWEYDVEQLLNRMVETTGLQRRVSTRNGPPQTSRTRWLPIAKWAGVALAGLLVVSVIVQESTRDGSGQVNSQLQQQTPTRFDLPNLTAGTWTLGPATSDDGTDWSNSTLKILTATPTPEGLDVTGVFDWRTIDLSQGYEEVTGQYVASSRQLFLEGRRIIQTDSQAAKGELALASYSAVLSQDGRMLLDGHWGSTTANPAGFPGSWQARR